MEAALYESIYLTVIGVLALITGLHLMVSGKDTLTVGVHNRGNTFGPFILCLAMAIFLGLRPVSGGFGDTINYALFYASIDNNAPISDAIGSEWGWDGFTWFCHYIGLSVNIYFLIIELAYILISFAAVRKFVPTSPWLGTIFVLGALFFFSFGTNGLRNGVACSIVLLIIAYILEERYLPAILLTIVAFSIHRSCLLPIGGCVLALTVVKNPVHALYCWIGSILLSLFFGNYWMDMIADVGFDDRLAQYADTSEETLVEYGTTSSFRWDFLAYSAVPIIYFFYTYARGLRDGWFNTLIITYMVANAFWVLMIRSAFTNRFAYLSWFLIPVIFAYPLCNMKVWRSQNFNAGLLLISYVSITVIFLTFVW